MSVRNVRMAKSELLFGLAKTVAVFTAKNVIPLPERVQTVMGFACKPLVILSLNAIRKNHKTMTPISLMNVLDAETLKAGQPFGNARVAAAFTAKNVTQIQEIVRTAKTTIYAPLVILTKNGFLNRHCFDVCFYF